MLKDESIKKLSAISTPKVYKKGQYIFYEGEPGNEMFIILRGSVGIYVTNSSDTLSEVACLKAGEIFGEMAVFDSLPRSASCVAAEDLICIAIGKDDIEPAVAVCPDIAMMLIRSMSGRIRKLNDEIYKSRSDGSEQTVEFTFPKEYDRSHDLAEPRHEEKYIISFSQACPICKSMITLKGLKKNEMTLTRPDKSGRVTYEECDPMWYDIWNCPHCGYSRYYRDFFNISEEAADSVKAATEQIKKESASRRNIFNTRFDKLVLSYLTAIHIAGITDPGNRELSGRMWLSLYRLLSDAGDINTALAFGKKAAEDLIAALRRGSIRDEYSIRLLALAAADIFAQTDMKDEACELCDMCISGTNQLLIEYAYRLKRSL